MKKIAIIGPESTGKSTLCEGLAAHYDAAWVPEYARGYIDRLGRDYEEGDLLEIARGQIEAESRMESEKSDGLLFCDTDLYVIKVWSEHKYNNCHPWIMQQIARREYDLYLLTAIDLPWSDDPQRENPEPRMREYFFHIYRDIVQQSGVPWILVGGTGPERLKNAIWGVGTTLT